MTIASGIRADVDRFVAHARTLVELETPTRSVPHCTALGHELAAWAQVQGGTVEVRNNQDRGPHVAARWDGGVGPATLVLMHYDTVWPVGTLAVRPFQRDGDVLTGPGVLDMKGGIAIFQLAIEHLRATGSDFAGPVTALFTSDEEDGSATSRTWIEDEARRHDRAFCLEPGADPFRLRTERKGVGRYVASFTGVASHAGNAPELGASAVLEASRFALSTIPLNDARTGVTCVVGVMNGGSVVNVVPAHAIAEVDLRVWTTAQAAEADTVLRAFVPVDPRVGFHLEGGLTRPPLERSRANDDLFTQAAAFAVDLGRDLGRAAVGGGSDGSITSATGCATLDGMGACGDGPHTVDEYVRIGDSLDKAAILAMLLTARA